MTETPDVIGRPLMEALKLLEAAGRKRIRVNDITMDRAQGWPLFRVIRQAEEEGTVILTVCRFPEAL